MQEQACVGGISYHPQPATNCLSCPHLKGYPISQQSCWRGIYCTCCSKDKTSYQNPSQDNLVWLRQIRELALDRCLCGHAKAAASKRKLKPRTQKQCLLARRDLEQDIHLLPKTHSQDLVFLIRAVDTQQDGDEQWKFSQGSSPDRQC